MSKANQSEADRFKGPKKWLEYLLARAFISSLQRMPVRANEWVGRALGWCCWKCLKRRRATVHQNLEVVQEWLAAQGQAAPSIPIEQQVRTVFMRSGANLLSGIRLAQLPAEKLQGYLQIEGLDTLRAALAQERGAILVLAHMGPWEAFSNLAPLMARLGVTFKFGAMYRPLNNTYLDRWYRKQRQARGATLYSRRDGFHKPVDFVRGGGLLAVLADQKMREGPSVPFMGHEVTTMPLPGLFMRRAKAPMLSAALFKTGPSRWCVRFESVDFPADVDLSDRAVCARRVNQALEQVLACSVADGFWFQKRF
ncbi:MAG: lysophospholipid acyltransferase family protein, partial [Lentimonas sp.]